MTMPELVNTPVALRELPSAAEHPPSSALYLAAAATLVDLPERRSLLHVLRAQPHELHTLLRGIDERVAHRAYAEGKWTLAESLLHVVDTERVFAYRLLRIARGDHTPLPGFDHDAWVPRSGASHRTLADLLTEMDAVRTSTCTLAESVRDAEWRHVGTSSGHATSARALAWMIVGHFAHHVEITRTRYLSSAGEPVRAE
jgi:hypothetical protein